VNPPDSIQAEHALAASASTAAIALRLGKYFGTTPELWMNLQASYELRLVRAKDWPKIEYRVRLLAAE
jgi:antitoxin HigA-1